MMATLPHSLYHSFVEPPAIVRHYAEQAAPLRSLRSGAAWIVCAYQPSMRLCGVEYSCLRLTE